MELREWIGSYKVEAFPWIDGKRIYVNVQYYRPGQSIHQPPAWDKTIYVTDDDAGRILVFDLTHALVENISMVEIKDSREVTFTVLSHPPSLTV